ncbi:hypothetical protein G9A89_000537 [Geosiphon pyriformis]|nr:hypothetical protein G9A89_000537 [Geosiphon pyriformis]
MILVMVIYWYRGDSVGSNLIVLLVSTKVSIALGHYTYTAASIILGSVMYILDLIGDLISLSVSGYGYHTSYLLVFREGKGGQGYLGYGTSCTNCWYWGLGGIIGGSIFPTVLLGCGEWVDWVVQMVVGYGGYDIGNLGMVGLMGTPGGWGIRVLIGVIWDGTFGMGDRGLMGIGMIGHLGNMGNMVVPYVLMGSGDRGVWIVPGTGGIWVIWDIGVPVVWYHGYGIVGTGKGIWVWVGTSVPMGHMGMVGHLWVVGMIGDKGVVPRDSGVI